MENNPQFTPPAHPFQPMGEPAAPTPPTPPPAEHHFPHLPHHQPQPHQPAEHQAPQLPTPEFTPQPPVPRHQPQAFVSPEPVMHTPVIAAQTPVSDQPAQSVMPMPVVRVLSPRGVEYVFMTIALFTGALGLGAALLSLVNGQLKFSVLAFPVATMLVAVPVFSWLFLRLKNAELQDPALRLDASKRRSTQFIQIFSFLIGFFTLIGLVSTIFAKMAGEFNGSIVKVFLDIIVVELIAGGILAYYWRDEHRTV